MTDLKPKNYVINIIRRKKEIYYSLFTVVLSFLIYFLIATLIDVADSQSIFPFFLLFFGILLIRNNLKLHLYIEDNNKFLVRYFYVTNHKSYKL